MQTATGFMNLAYSPLFQVYVLGRNLERPFKPPANPMMEALQRQQEGLEGDGEGASLEENGEGEDADDDDVADIEDEAGSEEGEDDGSEEEDESDGDDEYDSNEE